MENISVKHSGPSGDVIYSLPAVKKLAELHGPVVFYLHIGMKANYYPGAIHPDGDIALTEQRANSLLALLEAQPYVKLAHIWSGERIVLDLDRHLTEETGKPYGHISRWYFHLWPELTCDLSQPSLSVAPISGFEDAIIVNRTSRYRNPKISYKFLQHRKERIVFLGTLDELADFRRDVPRTDYQPTKNAQEMAEIIGNCRLFIGNQSMMFAIAEQLKVPRILEAAHGEFNNVIPTGEHAYDFFVQDKFVQIVELILS